MIIKHAVFHVNNFVYLLKVYRDLTVKTTLVRTGFY